MLLRVGPGAQTLTGRSKKVAVVVALAATAPMREHLAGGPRRKLLCRYFRVSIILWLVLGARLHQVLILTVATGLIRFLTLLPVWVVARVRRVKLRHRRAVMLAVRVVVVAQKLGLGVLEQPVRVMLAGQEQPGQ